MTMLLLILSAILTMFSAAALVGERHYDSVRFLATAALVLMVAIIVEAVIR